MSDALVRSVQEAIEPASSLEELGEALVSALRGFVQFDRLNIGLIDLDAHSFQDALVFGQNVEGRSADNVRTLDDTVVEAAMRSGGAYCFAHSDLAAWQRRFPRFGPVYKSGMRKMLAVMLETTNTAPAALVLASTDPEGYDAELLVDLQQVAPSIAAKLAELRK